MTRNELIEKMAKTAWENAVESASGRSPFILSADEKARIAEAFRPRYTAEMSAAITALEAAGYAVVPREPTEAIKVAGGVAFENAAFGEGMIVFDAAGKAYAAMIAAAQTGEQK